MRETNYDCLRGLSAFLVIALHASANDIMANTAHPNAGFSFACLISAFTRMSVPLFVMMSGAFVLAVPENAHAGAFYRKSWHRIVLPTLLWSIAYVACKYVFVDLSLAKGYQVDVWQPLKDWLAGIPYYHLWYLYMILGMYALVPLLIRLKNNMSASGFLWFGLISCLLGVFVDRVIPMWWPLQFLQYLGFFVMGYVIRSELRNGGLPANMGRWFRWRSRTCMLWSLFSVLIAYAIVDAGVRAQWPYALWWFSNQSPVIMISALACFLAFANMQTTGWPIRLKNLIERIAAQSFFIYLVHAGILHVLLYSLLKMHLTPIPFIFIPLATVVLFTLSFMLGEAVDTLKKKFIKSV